MTFVGPAFLHSTTFLFVVVMDATIVPLGRNVLIIYSNQHQLIRLYLLGGFCSFINTLSTSVALPYRYSLDRYGTAWVHACSGTVRIHLSTLQTEWTKLYWNSLIRNDRHKILGLGLERNGTE